MKTIILLLTAILIGGSQHASAQGALERQHPRVSELQDKLTEYARDYMKTRLPDIPFLVNVKIEPLRRAVNSGYQPQNEKLPFFEIVEEEIRDEWDDPTASMYTLQSRIQKATVLITLPKSLRGEEVDEIKDSLTSLLRLIPGRDEVRVELRTWSLGANFWYYVALGAGLLAALILGIYVVSRSWTTRLAGAISQIKPKEQSADVGASVSAPTSNENKTESLQNKSHLKFNDPLRTREFVNGRVAELLKNPNFPNLEAIIEMDKMAMNNPKELGALLMEFPLEKQAEIFGMSFNTSWLDAFSDPGELGPMSIELLDRLSRIHYNGKTAKFSQLLIQVWRLGEERSFFCKEITRDEAFAILKALPASIGVPTGRKTFPGAWAPLLDVGFVPKRLSESQIDDLMKKALHIKPHLDFKALDRYRQERDLIDYLQVASIAEEQDIYEALPKGSLLWNSRPPFYKIFEANDDILKKMLLKITLDDWSMALFNVSRERRKKIEDNFNSKQKYLLTHKMRIIDQSKYDRKLLSAARQKIGRIYFDLLNEAKISAQDSQVSSSEESVGTGDQAA